RIAVQRHLHRRPDFSEHFLRVERQHDVAGGSGPLERALEDDARRALAHDASAIPASTSPACSHCARVTSRCVTARNVRGPKANSSTPFSLARATIVAASGALSSTRKTTMFVWTVVRSSAIRELAASRLANSAALPWSTFS